MEVLMLVLYAFCGVVVGIPAGALLLPPLLLFRIMFVWPWQRNKLLERAIKNGTVVTARYVKTTGYMHRGESGTYPTGNVTGLYEYEYNGKKIRKRLTGRRNSDLVREVELYFVKNPKKASVATEIGLNEPNLLGWYLLSVGIVCIAVILLGVFYVNERIL